MSTSIIPKNDIRSLIGSDKFREQVAAALPAHLTPERFARVCLTALTRTPKLMECTRESLLRCLMDCSALGIEPDGRRAHLIPFGKDCTLIIDYKGLVELIRRSGEVAAIRAETVCENDEFQWENGVVTHRVDWRNPRGEVQAVYAEAKLTSGEVQTAVLTKDEVEGIRKRSRAGASGPWATDWSEMAKKTAIRRLSKLLPLSVEIAEAMDKDDDRLAERNVTPVPRIAALPEMIAEPEAEPVEEGGAE